MTKKYKITTYNEWYVSCGVTYSHSMIRYYSTWEGVNNALTLLKAKIIEISTI